MMPYRMLRCDAITGTREYRHRKEGVLDVLYEEYAEVSHYRRLELNNLEVRKNQHALSVKSMLHPRFEGYGTSRPQYAVQLQSVLHAVLSLPMVTWMLTKRATQPAMKRTPMTRTRTCHRSSYGER